MLEGIFITLIVFFGIYSLIKVFTDFLLKRKIIKMGHLEKAGILDQLTEEKEDNRYQTLKWGLVALMAGAGLIVIEAISHRSAVEWVKTDESFMAVGIELVFIAAGFLIYFLIVTLRKKS
jgi:di/tricarboxylate transporter